MASTNTQLEILKRNTKAKIAIAVAEHGPMAKADIARATGLALTSISKAVRELINEGELREVGIVPNPRGRPATLIDLDNQSAPVAGVWIGPESIEVAIANVRGEIITRRTIAYEWDAGDVGSGITAIVDGIQQCADAAGRNVSLLRGVGVTVAGYADPVMGVIEDVTNRYGWESVPIVKLLNEQLDVPIFTDEDTRAGALFHHWFSGEGRDGGSIYIIAIEGIGAAFIHNQELVRGAHDGAGMLFHTTIDPEGPPCPCRSRGCLELFASDLAFIRYIWPEEARTASEISVSERIELVRKGLNLAKQGDPQALKALRTVAKYMGIGVANGIRMLDPSTVFIAGTLMDIEPEFVLQMIREECMPLIWARTRSVEIRALVGYEDFLLRGAVGLVLLQPYRMLQQDAQEMSASPIYQPVVASR